MRIIEKLLKNYKNTDLCLDYIKDFDYTKLDENKFYNYINDYLDKAIANSTIVNSFGGKLVLEDVQNMCLADGKVYPVFKSKFTIGLCGNIHKSDVYICPFGCFKVDGDFVYKDVLKKNITKAVVNFMTVKYGEKYCNKRKEYLNVAKELKLKSLKQNCQLQAKQVEEEYK